MGKWGGGDRRDDGHKVDEGAKGGGGVTETREMEGERKREKMKRTK